MGDLAGVFIKEGRQRLLGLTTVFAVAAIVALAVNLIVPKRWDASAVIVVESSNIIKPLMEGRAVTMGVTDQTALITQIVNSKRILREIVAFGGLAPKSKMSPAEEQVMLDKLKGCIKIETPREMSIKIGYHDTDPKRAALVTNKIAEIYVREGSSLKEKESREAFEFINDRVKEYAQRLGEDHMKLLAYYRGQNLPAAPETDTPTPAVVDQPARLKISAEELAELRAEEATLSTELGHKPATRAGPDLAQTDEQVRTYRTRVLQLQGDLDRLLVTYTDEHPDVKRTKRDLAIASEELHHAEQARSDRDSAQAKAATVDDEVVRAARERLAAVQTKIAAATGTRRRVSTAGSPRMRAALADPASLDPEMKGVGQDTTLSELLRRYEATRDVYQDLLKRRENARVSMDLDAEHRGLTMHIEEAADIPVIATGMRLLQTSLIGLLLAAAIPLAFLVALVKLDPRVRTASQIERVARLPLLVSIPYASGDDARPARSQSFYAALMVAAVLFIYATTFIVRLKMSS